MSHRNAHTHKHTHIYNYTKQSGWGENVLSAKQG